MSNERRSPRAGDGHTAVTLRREDVSAEDESESEANALLQQTHTHAHTRAGADVPAATPAGTTRIDASGHRRPYICIMSVIGTVAAFILAGIASRWDVANSWNPNAHTHTQVQEVTASPADSRAFRHLTLKSGLQAILVSDPEADMAGAAVDVRVGSLHDPREFSGLAHAVEHCLFLGTLKYPGENEYNAFLARHAGYSNAFTSLDHTNYFFSVGNDALHGALDRFAQFFSAPLFASGSVHRELRAVDSEHRKNLQHDAWRLFQLSKELADEGSTYHGFSTGSLDTLNKTGVRAAMLAFHAAHYHAGNMRVAVVGNYSLDELQGWVEQLFVDVPPEPRRIRVAGHEIEVTDVHGRTLPASSPFARLYAEEIPDLMMYGVHVVAAQADRCQQEVDAADAAATKIFTRRGALIDVLPVTAIHDITMLFPLSSQIAPALQRSSAAAIVSALLGDEGQGSVLSYLKAAGLAESLRAGLDVSTPAFATLEVSVTLSPSALARVGVQNASMTDETRPARVRDHLHSLALAVISVLHAYAEQLRIVSDADVASATAKPSGTATAIGAFGALMNTSTGELVSWPGDDSSAVYRTWLEQRTLANLAFQYPERRDPANFASDLAGVLQYAGPQDILAPPDRRIWLPHAVRTVVEAITPTNALIFIRSAMLEESVLPSTEPIYGTRYASTMVAGETWASIVREPMKQIADVAASEALPDLAALALPGVNPYIPTNMQLKDQATFLEARNATWPASANADLSTVAGLVAPVLLDAPGTTVRPSPIAQLPPSSPLPTTVWWLPDVLFGQPSSGVTVVVDVPLLVQSPSRAVLTAVWAACMQEAVRERFYAAARMGATMDVVPLGVRGGVRITMEAYGDVLPRLLVDFLPNILAGAPDASVAANQLQLLVQALQNKRKDQTYVRALYLADIALHARRFSDVELLRAAWALASPQPTEPSVEQLYAPGWERSRIDRNHFASVLTAHAASLLVDTRGLELVFFGNVLMDDALKLTNVTASLLRQARAHASASASDSDEYQTMRVKGLPQLRVLLQHATENPDDVNSAAVLIGHLGLRDEPAALLELMNVSQPVRMLRAAPQAVWDMPSNVAQDIGVVRNLDRRNTPELVQTVTSTQLTRTYRARARALRAALRAAVVPAARGLQTGSRTESLGELPAHLRIAAFNALLLSMHEAAFDELRTKQQLGYIVALRARALETSLSDSPAAERAVTVLQSSAAGAEMAVVSGTVPATGDVVLSAALIVQGADHEPADLDERASAFIKAYQESIGTMDAQAWTDLLKGLAAQIRAIPLSSQELHAQVVDEILRRSYRFTRRIDQVTHLSEVTQQHVLGVYLELFGATAGRLTVHIAGQGRSLRLPQADARADIVLDVQV